MAGVKPGMEGGGTAKQREAHMACMGHVSSMLRRKGHQRVSDWVQRSICSALTIAKARSLLLLCGFLCIFRTPVFTVPRTLELIVPR